MTLSRGNTLLERLPESDRQRLRPLLTPVTLEFDQVLYESGGLIKFVYFPTGAVLSALTIMEDGNGIEVGWLAMVCTPSRNGVAAGC